MKLSFLVAFGPLFVFANAFDPSMAEIHENDFPLPCEVTCEKRSPIDSFASFNLYEKSCIEGYIILGSNVPKSFFIKNDNAGYSGIKSLDGTCDKSGIDSNLRQYVLNEKDLDELYPHHKICSVNYYYFGGEKGVVKKSALNQFSDDFGLRFSHRASLHTAGSSDPVRTSVRVKKNNPTPKAKDEAEKALEHYRQIGVCK